jgi:hypothetical protein
MRKEREGRKRRSGIGRCGRSKREAGEEKGEGERREMRKRRTAGPLLEWPYPLCISSVLLSKVEVGLKALPHTHKPTHSSKHYLTHSSKHYLTHINQHTPQNITSHT